MWGTWTALLSALQRFATLLGSAMRVVKTEDRVLGLLIFFASAVLVAYFYFVLDTDIGIPIWDLSAMLLAAAIVNIMLPPSLTSANARLTPETFETMPLRLVAMGLAAMVGGLVGEIREQAPPQEVQAYLQKGQTACAYDHAGLGRYFKGLYASDSVLRAEYGSFNLETAAIADSGIAGAPEATEATCPDTNPPTVAGYALSTYMLEFVGRYATVGLTLAALFISLRIIGAMQFRLIAWAASAGGALFYAFSLFMLYVWKAGDGGEFGYYLQLTFAALLAAGAFYLSCWLGARLSGTVAATPGPIFLPRWLIFLIALAAIVAGLYLLSAIIGGGSLKPFFDFLAWIIDGLASLFSPLKFATVWVLIFSVFGVLSLVLWLLRRTWSWLLTGLVSLMLAALILWWFFCAIMQREGFVPDDIRRGAERAGLCPCSDKASPPPVWHDTCGNYVMTARCPQSDKDWTLQTCKGGMERQGQMCGCPVGQKRVSNACGCVPDRGDTGATTRQPPTPECKVLVNFPSNRDKPQDQGEVDRMISRFSSWPCDTKKIRITGHADRVGSNAYNCGLSRRRAIEVHRILTEALGGGRTIIIRDAGEVCKRYERWRGVPYDLPYDYRGEEDAVIDEHASDYARARDRAAIVEAAPDDTQ